jgi:hypothetical protein
MSRSLVPRPYRGHSVATPLEALVQRGALSVPTRRRLQVVSLVAVVFAALSQALAAGLLGSNPFLWLLLVIAGAWITALVARHFSDAARHDRRVRRRLARLSLPIEGSLVAWLASDGPGPGALELVLRARHRLAESAVQVALPGAALTWLDGHVLRVEPRWSGDAADTEAILRLLEDVLAPHADELELLRVRALPPALAAPEPVAPDSATPALPEP